MSCRILVMLVHEGRVIAVMLLHGLILSVTAMALVHTLAMLMHYRRILVRIHCLVLILMRHCLILLTMITMAAKVQTRGMLTLMLGYSSFISVSRLRSVPPSHIHALCFLIRGIHHPDERLVPISVTYRQRIRAIHTLRLRFIMVVMMA